MHRKNGQLEAENLPDVVGRGPSSRYQRWGRCAFHIGGKNQTHTLHIHTQNKGFSISKTGFRSDSITLTTA